MKIVSLELNNFRRFRAPLRLDGFSDGLNVVVEPNETGKSTLLEALRAALFIRHSAKTELTRSYCPIGDEVAPRVAVEFEIRGDRWAVEKQFLRSHKVMVTGPGGRFESDAAEEKLQALLGFERGNNKGTDPDTRGSLGLLWVEQASAFQVDAPNRLVRDNVRSALESEVGAITGGRRFEIVRARVEDAHGELRTGKQGKSTGRLLAAEERARIARERRVSLEALAKAHDQTLSDLEEARAARRRIERELGDEEQVRVRAQLLTNLKLGESAAERLATERARFEVANGAVERLADRLAAIIGAENGIGTAEGAYQQALAAMDAHGTERDAAVEREAEAGSRLTSARDARSGAETAVSAGREAFARGERGAAIARARERLSRLDALEAELVQEQRTAGQAVAAKALELLATLDQAVIEARAVVSAGAVRIELISLDGTVIKVGGDQASGGTREVTSATLIEIGEHATIRVIPPGAGSAAAQLTAAEAALATALSRHGVSSYADAVARGNAGRAAAQAVAAVKRQIETLCISDPALGLTAGAAALRALVSTSPADDAGPGAPVDLAALEAEHTRCAEAESAARGRHDATIADLRAVEETTRKLGITLAGKERDLANARARLAVAIEQRAKADLDADLVTARRELAKRLQNRDAAEQAIGGFDVDRLKARIANIDKAASGASDRRMALIEKIAGLEATIENEGAKGLAGQVDAAQEEEAAAEQAVVRLTAEADTLELLRTTLREAQDTASRTFLGPVTRRAVQHVRRVLPDCDVTFSEELGLTSIVRGGVCEGCGDLSRGTQEQLAVLTRLAFADMLLDKGEPVSLILDDPLVYSDDARLEIMTDILTSTAERMQVILLTCRERAFRHVGSTRVTISP